LTISATSADINFVIDQDYTTNCILKFQYFGCFNLWVYNLQKRIHQLFDNISTTSADINFVVD
jgi:hypothetical protein